MCSEICKRCTIVTVFAALLLPILLYSCCHLCGSLVTTFAAFLDAGYTKSFEEQIAKLIAERDAALLSAKRLRGKMSKLFDI